VSFFQGFLVEDFEVDNKNQTNSNDYYFYHLLIYSYESYHKGSDIEEVHYSSMVEVEGNMGNEMVAVGDSYYLEDDQGFVDNIHIIVVEACFVVVEDGSHSIVAVDCVESSQNYPYYWIDLVH
jgi:enolase